MIYCSDINDAQKHARVIYPDLADVQFEIPPQGQQNFVLIYKDNVIRIARHEWSAKTMPCEAAILKLLEPNCPLSIPILYNCVPDQNIMRTSRVTGRHLTDKDIEKLPHDRIHAIADQMAGFLAHLHGGVILSADQMELFCYNPGYFHGRVLPRIDTLLQNSETPKGHRVLLEKAKSYLTNYDTLSDDNVLTHGDLTFGNILYDDAKGTIGIIDFTGASVGYRHLDFRKMLSYPEPLFNMIIEAYENKTDQEIDVDLVKTAYCLNRTYNWDVNLDALPDFIV